MSRGHVYLIGAGPGSADLITLRGLHALRKADLIIGDSLLSPDLLDAWGIDASNKTLLWRDRSQSRHEQPDLNMQMLTAAQAGQCVARIKTGDPLVFGRGLEEAHFLREHNVCCEIIPGLCSALAGPTSAEWSLTQRGTGRSFAVTTGRLEEAELNADLPRADSLVLMMAVGTLNIHVANLRRTGWPAETPVAIIERAEQPWQRRIHGTLATIVTEVTAASLESPAIIVVGAAADIASQRPRILFTGLDPSNFRVLGDLLHWPALEIVRDDAGWATGPGVLDDLGQKRYDHAIFTSRVGVTSFFQLLTAQGLDARRLAGLTVIAAGAGTAMRLQEHGIRADIAPEDAGSRGILASIDPSARAVLLIQGSHAPRGLVESLTQRGCDVSSLPLHTVQPHPELGRPLPPHEIVYFVSPSGVRSYVETYGHDVFSKTVWCMGDITQAEVNRLGGKAEVVSPYASDIPIT